MVLKNTSFIDKCTYDKQQILLINENEIVALFDACQIMQLKGFNKQASEEKQRPRLQRDQVTLDEGGFQLCNSIIGWKQSRSQRSTANPQSTTIYILSSII